MQERDLLTLERAVRAVASRQLPAAQLVPAALARAAEKLSALYTTGRQALREGSPVGADLLAARLLFFLPLDAPKLLGPLAELRARGWPAAPSGQDREPRRWLDLGAGVGAMSAGALLALAPAGLGPDELTLVDQDVAALALAGELLVELGLPAGGVRTETAGLDRWLAAASAASAASGRRHHLVLCGNVLNELGGASQASARRLRAALELLAPGGALVVVEPATREIARALHQVRDELLRAGDVQVVAPCLRQGDCPMLARERDWCHEDLPAPAPPPGVAGLVRMTRLRRERLKYAYLVLVRPGALPPPPPDTWRATGEVQGSKGKHEVDLCGPAGLLRVVRLRRHRAESSAAFERIRRGDRVRLPGPALEALRLEGPARGQARLAAGAEIDLVEASGSAASGAALVEASSSAASEAALEEGGPGRPGDGRA